MMTVSARASGRASASAAGYQQTRNYAFYAAVGRKNRKHRVAAMAGEPDRSAIRDAEQAAKQRVSAWIKKAAELTAEIGQDRERAEAAREETLKLIKTTIRDVAKRESDSVISLVTTLSEKWRHNAHYPPATPSPSTATATATATVTAAETLETYTSSDESDD